MQSVHAIGRIAVWKDCHSRGSGRPGCWKRFGSPLWRGRHQL